MDDEEESTANNVGSPSREIEMLEISHGGEASKLVKSGDSTLDSLDKEIQI